MSLITNMNLVAATYNEQRTNGCANRLPFQSQPNTCA